RQRFARLLVDGDDVDERIGADGAFPPAAGGVDAYSAAVEESVPGLALVVLEFKGQDVRLDQSSRDRLGRHEPDALLEQLSEDAKGASCVALGRKAISDQRLFPDLRPAGIHKCAAVPLEAELSSARVDLVGIAWVVVTVLGLLRESAHLASAARAVWA